MIILIIINSTIIKQLFINDNNTFDWRGEKRYTFPSDRRGERKRRARSRISGVCFLFAQAEPKGKVAATAISVCVGGTRNKEIKEHERAKKKKMRKKLTKIVVVDVIVENVSN